MLQNNAGELESIVGGRTGAECVKAYAGNELVSPGHRSYFGPHVMLPLLEHMPSLFDSDDLSSMFAASIQRSAADTCSGRERLLLVAVKAAELADGTMNISDSLNQELSDALKEIITYECRGANEALHREESQGFIYQIQEVTHHMDIGRLAGTCFQVLHGLKGGLEDLEMPQREA